MIKRVLANKRVGSYVEFKYPTHGNMNILRWVRGIIESKGNGPCGPFVGVKEKDLNKPHNFSTGKIVED